MYELTKTLIKTDKETQVMTYGIKNELEVFDSISADFAEVEALCKSFNDEGLDKLHFKDAVEDFIVEKAFGTHEEKDL